jgi:hypothetical protein
LNPPKPDRRGRLGVFWGGGIPLGWEHEGIILPERRKSGNELDKFLFYHYFKVVFERDNLNCRGTASNYNSPSPQKEYQNLI